MANSRMPTVKRKFKTNSNRWRPMEARDHAMKHAECGSLLYTKGHRFHCPRCKVDVRPFTKSVEFHNKVK